jgi:putative chitinase
VSAAILEFFDAAETEALLRAVAPKCREPEAWAQPLSTAMYRFGIGNDRETVAAFIAQLAVESGQLNRVAEDLTYNSARLLQVWPKRFPNIATAQRYANNPRDLANYVYANRMGNGPPESDDGWRYRGRGPIQTTGKANYARLQGVLGIPLVLKPELLEEKAVGALGAAWFWWEHKLSFLAADLQDDDQAADFVTITRVINGGTHGLAQRQAYLAAARAHMGLS